MIKSKVFILLTFALICKVHGSNYRDIDCFEKWLSGYRLATGRPQRVYSYFTLEKCQDECIKEDSCAALAFGVGGSRNGTCELALRTLRDSRSVGNATLPYAEVKKAPEYDIYLMTSNCAPKQRQPLFGGSNSLEPVPGNGVPIDCFYRLMSGKRLARNLVTKSITSSGLQECQEACIDDRDCLSISYRYMVSGYTYNVANCELSAYHIRNYEDSYKLKYDFIDDYDYDYFQRESHCKTTSRLGAYGVCAVVVKQGAKLVPSLIKSSHETSTATQCEFLCSTASRFRCRAFAVRHTTRGRDPFHRDSRYETTCILYDVDISRLPQYDVVADPDYDLYEMGRLMGAECLLQDQYLNRRPSDNYPSREPQPIIPPRRPTDSYIPPVLPPSHRESGSYLPHHNYDYHPRRPASYPDDRLDRPPALDPRQEGCLIKVKQDVYLAPEVTRATFPTKTLEECRTECTRAVEVLRFVCRMMSFRLTSNSGGSCQLSEFKEMELRTTDYIAARDRYQNAVVFAEDPLDVYCRGGSSSSGSGSGRYGDSNRFNFDSYGRDRYGSDRDRYGSDRDRNRYGQTSIGGYLPSRYDYQNMRPYDDRDSTNRRYGDGMARDPYGSSDYYGKGHVSYPSNSNSGGYLSNGPETNPVPMGIAGQAQTQTVNGEKCLRPCVRDREAGFYYCVVDSRGTWDFCCRPDHFCGYSRGLSVPWCYVGDGPTVQVWRSCSQRISSPAIAYLHDRSPPQVLSLPNDEVAGLSKDVALKYFKSSLEPPKVSEDFEDIDNPVSSASDTKDETRAEGGIRSLVSLNSTEVFGNTESDASLPSLPNSNARQGRELPTKPKFTVVEVRRSSSSA